MTIVVSNFCFFLLLHLLLRFKHVPVEKDIPGEKLSAAGFYKHSVKF